MNLRQGALLQGGKYRIERELGHGGFGITYLAVQTGLNRRVAIKEFFMSEYCNRDAETSHVSVPSEGSKELVARFRNKFVKEAQNIACLKHPHIIGIHDVFEENGTAYYVMEYLDHGSLADLVKQRGRLPEAAALRYTRQIADALSYIHARKMNHLDVKPGNILVDEADGAVLIDFGLSKRYDDEGNQTSTTPVGISHGYAPLEQYKKSGVGTFSPATDIYSLGATLYKLITGATPPDANDVMDDGLPALPNSVSPATVAAIENAMQPSRKNRPQSVKEFLDMLGNEVDETTVLGEDDRTGKEGLSLFSWCKDGSLIIYHFGKMYLCRDIVAEFNPSRVDEYAKDFDRYVQLIGTSDMTMETYIQNNKSVIRNSLNILTYRSLSDFHEANKLLKKYRDVSFRLTHETSLSALGFRTDIEASRKVEYEGWYCEADLGGGLTEILEYGRITKEGEGDKVSSPNVIKNLLAAHEAFYRCILGCIKYLLIINKDARLAEEVMLDAWPGGIDCWLMKNDGKTERFPLLPAYCAIPARKTDDIVTTDIQELCFVVCQRDFVIDLKEKFGHLPSTLKITVNLEVDSRNSYILLKDKIFDKEEKIALMDLYD